MTYWTFHLVFLLPVIGSLFLYVHHRAGAMDLPNPRLGFALVILAALLYTTPWDNYLVRLGVWSYQPERISPALVIGYVPLEEYCFFVLQPVFTGMCLLCLLRSGRDRLCLASPDRKWLPRVAGGTLALGLGAMGIAALATGGRFLYLGLILVWSAPPLVLHWFYGGDILWRVRRTFGASLALSTIYLWVVDRVAIGAGIWSISPLDSTRWNFLGLPVEEAVFFLVTNLLVLQGLLLFFRWVMVRRALPLP